MSIQSQLQKPEFKFILVQRGTKSPIEKGWPITEEEYEKQSDESWKNKVSGEIYTDKEGNIYYGPIHNYKFDEDKILTWIASDNPVGVMTGFPSDFCILDSETDFLYNIYTQNFPETTVNQSGSGKGFHILLFIKGIKDKIIFQKEDVTDDAKVTIHLGELQYKGFQCLIPDSTHPSGGRYKVLINKPIATIDYKDFERVFGPYFAKKARKKDVIKKWKKTKWKGDKIKDIPLTNIFNTIGLVKKGIVLQGPHPIHSSVNGQNFVINTKKNEWACYRHMHCGGGPWTAIAMTEGLINCDECHKGFELPDEIKKKVAIIAHEKYGLKFPEDGEIPNGWNKSVKISSMYEKYNKDNLHCGKPLIFDDERGIARCTVCSYSINLKELAEKAVVRIKLLEGLAREE